MLANQNLHTSKIYHHISGTYSRYPEPSLFCWPIHVYVLAIYRGRFWLQSQLQTIISYTSLMLQRNKCIPNLFRTNLWEKFMIKMFQKITLRAAFLIKNLAESVQMAGTVRTHNTSSARRVVPLVSSMSSKWSLRALIDRVKTAMAGRVFPPASFNSMVSSDS